MRNRRIWSLPLALGVVLVAVAVGLLCWANPGPAMATGDMGCAAEPGHHGCHVAPTTTTEKPTTTTAKPATTTTKASTATTKGGTGTTATTGGTTDTTASTTDSVTTTSAAPTTTTAATTYSVPSTEASTTTTAAFSAPVTQSDTGALVLFVDNNNCLSCHGEPDFTKQRPDGSSISLYVDPAALSHTVHRYQDCTDCHTDSPHEVQTPLTKLSLAQKCGSCHEYQYAQYIQSVHGTPQTSGNSDPASCVDCHSASSNPHNVVRALDQSASIYPKNVAQTCAKCHDDPKLMEKYGIVEKVYESYMRSFHGKAMSLSSDNVTIEQLRTATCINCHGTHNIKSATDPNSPVAGMENLAKTCEQCHPGAGVEFASGFLGHRDADLDYFPQVFVGERFFYVFTRVVLVGGVLMVALPLGRWGVGKLRGERKSTGKEE